MFSCVSGAISFLPKPTKELHNFIVGALHEPATAGSNNEAPCHPKANFAVVAVFATVTVFSA